MQFAIIQTSTRVIRRLTTNNPPTFLADETSVDTTANQLDLAGGPWKLDVDNKTLVKPSQAEIDASGVDDVRNDFLRKQKIALLDAAVDDIILNGTGVNLITKVKVYFQALKDLRGS